MRGNGVDLTRQEYLVAKLVKLEQVANALIKQSERNEKKKPEEHIHFELIKVGEKNACGTTACVAGTAALLLLPKKDISWRKSAGEISRIGKYKAQDYDVWFSEFFNLPLYAANMMTDPYLPACEKFYGVSDHSEVTAEMAGKRILRWIKRQRGLHRRRR